MTDHRAQLIADIRRLADHLEAHPELPVGRWDTAWLQHSVTAYHGYDESDTAAMVAVVEKAAEAMGVEMKISGREGQDVHYTAGIKLGRAEYQVAAIFRTAEEGAETS